MDKVIIDYIIAEVATERLEQIDVKEDLLGSGIINSMGMMKILLFIEKKFNVQVPPEDMTLENFMSVERIQRYVSSKQG